MNFQEVTAVIDLIKSLRPAQKWDETTEMAWHMVLGDDPDDPDDLESIGFADALKAVRRLARTQKWIDTDDICREAGVVAKARKGIDYKVLPAPDCDPDDTSAYLLGLRALLRDAAAASRLPAVDPAVRDAARERQRVMFSAVGRMPDLRALEMRPDAVRGPDRPDTYVAARAVVSGQSEGFLRRRTVANTKPCTHPGCEAPVDRSCHLNGVTLTRSPAHAERLRAAGLEEEMPPVSAEQFKAILGGRDLP